MQENTPYQILEELYSKVSELDCSGCDGSCCVSPTMTAPEFTHMMRGALEIFGEKKLAEILAAPSVEHKSWEGTTLCRFQDPKSGLCTNYPTRALGCRLHGHEALRLYETKEMVFCNKEPSGNRDLSSEKVQEMVGILADLLPDLGLSIEPPYSIAGLNLECWLDIYYHPKLGDNRQKIRLFQNWIHAEVSLPELNPVPRHTTLAGKLNVLDQLSVVVENGNSQGIRENLRSLIFDFPSTGTFFIEEARELEKIFKARMSELEKMETDKYSGN